MNYRVIATEPYERKLKRLSRKYFSLKDDLSLLVDSLALNPFQGTPLGKNCYKIRLGITSKGRGKSGRARIITFVRVTKSTVYLMDIYDKSEQETISYKELVWLINILAE